MVVLGQCLMPTIDYIASGLRIFNETEPGAVAQCGLLPMMQQVIY
jgi:hypothetical protein